MGLYKKKNLSSAKMLTWPWKGSMSVWSSYFEALFIKHSFHLSNK